MFDFPSSGAGWCVAVIAFAVGVALLVWIVATAIVFVARKGNASVREAAEGIATVLRAVRRRHP